MPKTGNMNKTSASEAVVPGLKMKMVSGALNFKHISPIVIKLPQLGY
jgi:hypothetical protein